MSFYNSSVDASTRIYNIKRTVHRSLALFFSNSSGSFQSSIFIRKQNPPKKICNVIVFVWPRKSAKEGERERDGLALEWLLLLYILLKKDNNNFDNRERKKAAEACNRWCICISISICMNVVIPYSLWIPYERVYCSFVRLLVHSFIRSFTSYVIPCKDFFQLCCDVRAYLLLRAALSLSRSFS